MFNFNSLKFNKIVSNYSLTNFFVRNDFLFKTFLYKIKLDKSLIIYSLANKYSFGTKRHYSKLYVFSKPARSFVYYKYNSVLFDSITLFFENLFKFISFNLHNFFISSLNYLYFDLYLLLHNFFNFFSKFIKKANKKKSKFFYNKLFLNYFSIKNLKTKALFFHTNNVNKLVKNRKHYRFYL